jgi:4,5-dihydroxyphthalate decarboxylase
MQIAIGTYDHTKALKDGSVTSPKISFDFIEVSPITRAFRHMAAGLAYDVSEMALGTYMLAKVYDKAVVGLPIVLVRSSLLPGVVTAEARPSRTRASWRQNAGHPLVYADQWYLGPRHSQDAFGRTSAPQLGHVRGHLDNTRDPPNTTRWRRQEPAGHGSGDGELVAAIQPARLAPACGRFPDAAQAEADWAKTSGSRTVQHIVVVGGICWRRTPG